MSSKNITKITPDDSKYGETLSDMKVSPKNTGIVNYHNLSQQIVTSATGTILKFEGKKNLYTNIVIGLTRRKLTNGEDYAIKYRRSDEDAQFGTYFIEVLRSNSEG